MTTDVGDKGRSGIRCTSTKDAKPKEIQLNCGVCIPIMTKNVEDKGDLASSARPPRINNQHV